ncbi:MAG TPA: phage tail protein [Stellaceae bacterium]|nr:phage tail protein [Stellaceae bacterium]
MSGVLGGSTQSQASQTTKYSALAVQTAVAGKVIPLVWGRVRLAPNLIWYNDFTATPASGGSTSSGKGGGSSSSQGSSSYTYSASIMFALCEGPIDSVDLVWKDKDVDALGDLGMAVAYGTQGQAPWAWLASHHADQAFGYSGTAMVVVANYALGSSASLPTHNFQVTGNLAGAIGAPYPTPDAEPSQILVDFLTNTQYGAGFPAAAIGDLSNWRAYNLANTLLMSPLWETQQSASTYVTQLMTLTNSNCWWSEGKLKVGSYGDAAASAYGNSWTPNLTPIYDLTDDDFQAGSGEDPVLVTRSSPADAQNFISLEWTNCLNQFQTEPIEWKDQGAIEQFGLRKANTVTAHEIMTPQAATALVGLIGQRALYVRNSFAFKLGWQYCLLEPMDIVTLTDANLGLSRFPVRITQIQQQDDGTLAIDAEEFPAAVGTPTEYPKQTVAGYAANYAVDPGPVNTPVIFEPPPQLTGGEAQVWIAASGGGAWGGCDVWVSYDEVTYLDAGRINGPARQGTLTAALAVHADPDTTDTLSVSLVESTGQLISVSQADADAFNSLCFVDNELVSYKTATLTGPNAYGLTTLHRGVYGTPVVNHVVGAQFARLDGSIFKYTLPAAYVGVPLYVKLTSFNIYGASEESLADVAIYGLTPTGAGAVIAPPTNCLISTATRRQVDGTYLPLMVVSWTPSGGPLLGQYELQYRLDSTTSWQSILLGPNETSNTITSVVENVLYDARVRAISTANPPAYSSWALATATESVANTNPPGVPTGLATSSGLYTEIDLVWNANPEPDLAFYVLYEGLTTNFGTAAQIWQGNATGYARKGLNSGSILFYWLAAQNRSGIRGGFEGPVIGQSSYTIPIAALGRQVIQESLLVPILAAQIDQIATTATNDLTTAINTANAVLLGNQSAATIVSLQQQQSTDEAALASAITTLTAGISGVTAQIQQEATARATADSASATSLTTLVSLVGSVQAGVASTQAGLATLSNTEASDVSALSQQLLSLTASIGTTNASVTSQFSALATSISANASATTNLTTTVNGNSTTISQNIASINGLQAQYTVKVNNNGVVAGFGLASYPNNGGVASEFIVEVDTFAIVPVGGVPGTAISPFFVSGGTVYIQDALIGSVSANKITAGYFNAGTIQLGVGGYIEDAYGNVLLSGAGVGGGVINTPNVVAGAITAVATGFQSGTLGISGDWVSLVLVGINVLDSTTTLIISSSTYVAQVTPPAGGGGPQ